MIKAGGAGSKPDDIAKANEGVSQPLSDFLKDIGGAVFALNTIVVGLDAVENGHEKPDSLDISWLPTDRVIAARKARKFALESILVRASEAFNQYVMAVSRLSRFTALRDKWTGNTSVAEKISEISTDVIGPDYLTSSVVLLVHWRNRVVHRTSKAALRKDERRLLRKNEEEILKHYKRLSVDCLLCHFQEGRPTLKDISTLIAMSVNLARRIDEVTYRDLGKDDLDAWLDYYEIHSALEKIRLETAPEKLDASIRRMFAAQAPQLLKAYTRYYELDRPSAPDESS